MPVAAATTVGREQPSLAFRVLETVILSSYLLFWIPLIFGNSLGHSSDPGTIISEESPEIWFDHLDELEACSSMIGTEPIFTHLSSSNVCSVGTIIREPKTENMTAENISKMFRKYFQEGSSLKSVAVYSCPLNAPFSSSKVSVKKHVQRQYSALDYHAFVVFESDTGVWIALDKMIDGIFISWGRNQGSILFHFEGKFRPPPLRLLKKDDCNSSRSELIHHLEKLLHSNSYDLIQENCQHFSKKMFDKHAVGLSWDFATPSDLTSLLKFFSNGGLPMIMLTFFVCWLTELLLLLKKSEYRPAHPNVVYLTVIITSLLYGMILFFGRDQGMWKHFRTIISPMSISSILVFALFLEARFSPFGIVRRRVAHYGRNSWKSCNLLIKGFYIFCFTTVYTVTTVAALAYFLKSVLTYSETFSFPFLLKGTRWLTELLQVGVNLEAFAVFLFFLLFTYLIVKKYFYHPMLVIPIEYDCPLTYGKGNGTSTLNEILQHNGCKHAEIVDIKYNETSFSAKISFTLLDKKHEYKSDKKCRNKKEARQNAAFVALVDLRLMNPRTKETDVAPTQEKEEALPRKKSSSALYDSNTYRLTTGKNSKNQLQEFCQKYHHKLPKYTPHELCDDSLHAATVTVKLSDGQIVEETSDKMNSRKEAEFQAAERAMSVVTKGQRSRNNSNDSNSSISSFGSVPFDVVWKSMLETQKTSPIPDGRCSSPAPDFSRNISPKPAPEKKYKTLLQEFCQKNKLGMPDYDTKDELDQKSRAFLSRVTFKLKSGETVLGMSDKHGKRKDAEDQAAERAFKSISSPQFPAELRNPIPAPSINTPDIRAYKNLLQELCVKHGHSPPEYDTPDVGDKHKHIFVSTVSFELASGIQFSAKSDRHSTRKSAEMQAAQRAYEKICANNSQAAGS